MNKRPDEYRQGHKPSSRSISHAVGNARRDLSAGGAERRKSSSDRGALAELLHDMFSPGSIKIRTASVFFKVKNSVTSLMLHAFYARERILCGIVCAALLILFAMLQTTVFSTLRPFGMTPDLMILFTLALSVSEGRRWGAVWGMAAAVLIESLDAPGMTLLPLLYMPVGYFGGVLCKYYFTGSAAVRALLTFAALPLRGIVTAVYTALSPISASAGEIFFEVVIPEAAATLLLAAPVHLLVYVCMRPFNRTRAEKVSDL